MEADMVDNLKVSQQQHRHCYLPERGWYLKPLQKADYKKHCIIYPKLYAGYCGSYIGCRLKQRVDNFTTPATSPIQHRWRLRPAKRHRSKQHWMRISHMGVSAIGATLF